MIHDLRRQGLSISDIARKVGSDRKIVRKYLEQGLEVPNYGPRPLQGSFLDPYRDYLTERVGAFPDLSGRRLLREIKSMGYEGSYSTLKPFLRELRPARRAPFAVRFETPPGKQAQVDFAEFKVEFYVATRPVDFRKGMDGLALVVQEQFGLDPFIATCKMSGVNPVDYIAETLRAILDGHPRSQIDELMPWRFKRLSTLAA